MTTRKRPAGQISDHPQSVSGQAAKPPKIKGRFQGLCIQPEHVETILVMHRKVLEQDSKAIISGLSIVRNGKWPGEGQISVMDRLRSLSITFATSGKSSPQDVTPAGRNPFIHEYCRILGVPSDAIDQLFQRFMTGDVTDKRAVVSESERAIAQLDTAIQIAHQQWMNGDETIHSSKRKTPDDPADTVTEVLTRLESSKNRRILLAMLNLNATPDGIRVCAKLIAPKAIESISGPESIKDEMITLKGMGLVESTRGRNGGSKLTDLGVEVARKL